MRKKIRMITYLPYYHLDAAFDNGLRKDYGNSEIRYDHFYYKKKKLSFTRQEFCNAHQLGAGKSFRICLAKDCIIGAGSLVTKNTVIPDGSLVMGSPARIKRNLTWEEYSENIVALEKIHSNPIK